LITTSRWLCRFVPVVQRVQAQVEVKGRRVDHRQRAIVGRLA